MNIKSPVVSATALKSLKSGGVSHNVKIQPIRAGQGKPGGVLGRPVSLSAQRCWKERGSDGHCSFQWLGLLQSSLLCPPLFCSTPAVWSSLVDGIVDFMRYLQELVGIF